MKQSIGPDSAFTDFKVGASLLGKSPTPERMSPFHRASPDIPSSIKSNVTVKTVLSKAREEAEAPRASVGKPPRSSKKQTPGSKMMLAPLAGSQSPPAA
jgi:hypothetical protein|tara:strand:+ start:182 stop:478 length:297 start_codon:yes stop_codon:yes gene_type:complete